jgi:hypothetical protein
MSPKDRLRKRCLDRSVSIFNFWTNWNNRELLVVVFTRV